MTDTAVVFLAIMAVALTIMAVVQIGLIVVALRAARQVTATAEAIRRDVGPREPPHGGAAALGTADRGSRLFQQPFGHVAFGAAVVKQGHGPNPRR